MQVASDALERIADKVAHEMNKWEHHNGIVAGIKDNIIKVCKRDFELLEGQIAKIEGIQNTFFFVFGHSFSMPQTGL